MCKCLIYVINNNNHLKYKNVKKISMSEIQYSLDGKFTSL